MAAAIIILAFILIFVTIDTIKKESTNKTSTFALSMVGIVLPLLIILFTIFISHTENDSPILQNYQENSKNNQ